MISFYTKSVGVCADGKDQAYTIIRSIPSAHTRPPTFCKTRSRSPLPTLIICSILYRIYIASLMKIVSNLNMVTAAMAETCS